MTGTTSATPDGQAAGDEESQVPAWFRQTVEREFRVGDRVRIRLSPECVPHRQATDVELVPSVQGATGTIVPHPPETRIYLDLHPDHPYYVQIEGDGWWMPWGGIFAPIELELLPSTGPGRSSEEDEHG